MSYFPFRSVVAPDQLGALAAFIRLNFSTIVWTNGCFDLLHVGHVASLRAAADHGEVLVVGINSDASVRRLNGSGRPFVPAAQRAALVLAVHCVDYVVVFDDESPVECVRALRPDVVCKGAEYAPPDGRPMPERSIVTGYGGSVRYTPTVGAFSTSETARLIRYRCDGE